MILTLLVVFGALVIAAGVSALLAPGEIAAERPFLPSQCMARLMPISRPFRETTPNLKPRRHTGPRLTLLSRIRIHRSGAEARPRGNSGWPRHALTRGASGLGTRNLMSALGTSGRTEPESGVARA